MPTPAPDQTTVYVIDDDQAVRESLAWLIESVGLRVEAFETAKTFLEHITSLRHRPPGCAVVDVRLPGMSGLELQESLNRQGITLPVVVISGHGDVPIAVRAMKAGAVDFIEKPFSDQLLLERIREAIERDRDARTSEQDVAELERRWQGLSTREQQVMAMVVDGRLNKQIAEALALSPKTIEVHRAHVMKKMQARSLAELVRMAVALESVRAA